MHLFSPTLFTVVLLLVPSWAGASGPAPSPSVLTILDEDLTDGATWDPVEFADRPLRNGGHESASYLYLKPGDTPLSIRDLSLPIREHPGPGEYRFLSYAWRKWNGKPIALRLDPGDTAETNAAGHRHNFTLYAGDHTPGGGPGLRISERLGGSWQEVPIDLWKLFGDFTVQGLTFLVESRDAGFDSISFARAQEDFDSAAPLIQPQVAPAVEIDTAEPEIEIPADTSSSEVDEVRIDWAGQIKAGGFWMYPLYACALTALAISIQRLLTIREDRLAPRELREALQQATSTGDFDALLDSCGRHPSTLADVTRFVLEHRHASIEVVNQTAGDIAARDIRGHLSRIYPLSLISSISPLLGLLGTIIGMVEAFGIVALYGDEGGASILSDSISKALITTATGLIIAIPCIAVYFTLKNRITGLATVIESEVEQLVTTLYLRNNH